MSFRTKFTSTLLSLTTLLGAVTVFAAPSGDELLKKSDEIRNPSQSFKMKVAVESEDGNFAYEVFVKGKDKSVIATKSPAKVQGRNMLMIDKDFYLYMPNLKRSLRLSLSQKLSGQVANGDIARTRWYGDYDVKVEKQSPKLTTMLLDGRAKGLTYQKIRLIVSTDSGRPLSAEYLSLDGKVVLKSARFGGFKKIAGAERPTLIRIEDNAKKTSLIRIESMEKTELADSFFSQSKLESLR